MAASVCGASGNGSGLIRQATPSAAVSITRKSPVGRCWVTYCARPAASSAGATLVQDISSLDTACLCPGTTLGSFGFSRLLEWHRAWQQERVLDADLAVGVR